MKKLLIAGGIIVVAVLLFFFFNRTEEPIVIDAGTLPVITVDTGVVHLSKGDIRRIVESGEHVEAPFTLETSGGSLARVQFPDNSDLRIRENSKLTIEVGSYMKETGELKVHTKLSIGRVWSNIIALVTPASSWEVETSNVVATVRGTSFDTEAREDGSTRVTGSEHTIELTLIDPETGERDENRKAMLEEDEFVIIGMNDASDKTRPFPSKQKRGTDVDSWIQQNEGPGDKDPQNGSKQDEETSQILDIGITPPQNNLPKAEPEKPTVAVPDVKPVSIAITSSVPLGGIVEGTSVPLTAVAVYSDGTKREISNAATWSVIGNVGSMRGYIFDPLLGLSVSEMGRAYGSIVATWKDPVTGISLEGSTDIFEVKPKIVQGLQEG